MSFQSYSDYSDESDDEYAPLQISGWGTQQTQEGTTEVTVSMEGWSSLVDPTVKMKAGGIGSGQLHRKGKNFKPVDEQLILDRRLGKPLPKGGLNGEAKKKKKKKGKGGAPPQSKMPPPPPKPSKTMPPTFNRNRPPIKPGASAWSSNALVETPFWEKPNGSAASKWADPAPAAAPVSAPPVTQPSSWSQQQQQQQQQQQRTQPQQQWSQPPQQQQWAQPPQQPQQQPQQQQWAQPQPQQQWSHPQPQQQQPQSMWAQPQQQQQAHQQAPGWPHQPLLGTNASKYATPSAQTQSFAHPPQPAISQKSDIPKLTFKIELAPGVTANLPVYANDNPVDVVNEFEKKHHLVMSDAAKAKFAERVAMLLSQTAFSN